MWSFRVKPVSLVSTKMRSRVEGGGVARGEYSQWTLLMALGGRYSAMHCDSIVYICVPLLDTDSEINVLTLPSFFRQADGYWGCVLVYSSSPSGHLQPVRRGHKDD